MWITFAIFLVINILYFVKICYNRIMINLKIIEKLKGKNSICLIGHSAPDADALCSMITFKNFLVKQLGVKNVDLFADTNELADRYLPIVSLDEINPEPKDYDFVITLDTSNPILLGRYQSLLNTTKPVIVIDHHKTNLKYGRYNIVEICSSTCELVYKILKHFKYNFSDEDYGKIYAGILTDTNNLTVGAISHKSFQIAGECYKHCLGQEIYRHFFLNNSLKQQTIFAKAVMNTQLFHNGQILISYITKEEAKELKTMKEDYIGTVNRLAQTSGVNLTCFIYPTDDEFYVSLRVRQGYDAATIAKSHGGGGHTGAAAFESKLSIENIKNMILNDFLTEISTKNLKFSKNPFKNL